MQRKIWKRGAAFYRKRKALGTAYEAADQVATAGRWCWPYSGPNLQRLLTLARFDRIAMPRLTSPQLLEPPARRCGMGAA